MITIRCHTFSSILAYQQSTESSRKEVENEESLFLREALFVEEFIFGHSSASFASPTTLMSLLYGDGVKVDPTVKSLDTVSGSTTMSSTDGWDNVPYYGTGADLYGPTAVREVTASNVIVVS